MLIHRRNIIVMFIVLFGLLSSGCISSSSENQDNVKSTTLAPAMELYRNAIDAKNQGKYEIALDYFDQSIIADPTYTRAWIDKGDLLLQLNRSQEALSAYDSALALNNNVPEVWNFRGEALMTLGKYPEALESFEKALQITSNNYPAAQQNRDRVLAKLK